MSILTAEHPEPETAKRLHAQLNELQRRRAARAGLLAFTTYTFPTYKSAAHLVLLAQALEAIERREITRLLVTMPPRMGKSELVSVRFPAWYLGRHPDKRLILVSYAGDLAHRFSRMVRNLVESDDYQRVFPGMSLAPDSNRIDAFDLAGQRGGMRAVGVGGALTGHGADILCIDDPVKNREEANSETQRQSAWDWFTSTAYTRLEENAAIVCCSTRWHEDDLAGRLLAAQSLDPRADQWTVLHLPAIADDGSPLWPEKYPLEDLLRIQANVGARDWEALYQGRPQSPAGSVFRTEWLRTVEHAPQGLRWVRYWDLAASTKTSADFTASARCALADDGTLYIANVIRGRWEWPDARRVIIETARLERGGVIGIEKVGFQLAAIQDLRRDPAMAAITLREVSVDRDKLSRALPWAARAEAGKVALVSGPWVQAFLAECVAFPQGAHDDIIDSVSGCTQLLAQRSTLRSRLV